MKISYFCMQYTKLIVQKYKYKCRDSILLFNNFREKDGYSLLLNTLRFRKK